MTGSPLGELAVRAKELDFDFLWLENLRATLEGNLNKDQRILIVHDDNMLSKHLVRNLEMLGYEKVERLKTPLDFFDRLSRNPNFFREVACLITDYHFTEFDGRYVMSGTAFIRVIREGITAEKLREGLLSRIGTTPGSGVHLG